MRRPKFKIGDKVKVNGKYLQDKYLDSTGRLGIIELVIQRTPNANPIYQLKMEDGEVASFLEESLEKEL